MADENDDDLETFDVVVIGGGAAGLAATLALARMNRKVLLLDGGPARNSFSETVHNVPGADGMERQAYVASIHEELGGYEQVYHWDRYAMQLEPVEKLGFVVTLEEEEQVVAHAVILATGVTDQLPDIPGLHEGWGRTVLHCGYCHGYEVRDKPLGVLASVENVYDILGSMLSLSRQITVFFDGQKPSNELVARLAVFDIRSRPDYIEKVEEKDGMLEVTLEGGQVQKVAAMFVKSGRIPHAKLAEELGCELDEEGNIKTDAMGRTGVYNLYAAGDVTRDQGQIVFAQSAGLYVAIMVNRDLNATALKRR